MKVSYRRNPPINPLYTVSNVMVLTNTNKHVDRREHGMTI